MDLSALIIGASPLPRPPLSRWLPPLSFPPASTAASPCALAIFAPHQVQAEVQNERAQKDLSNRPLALAAALPDVQEAATAAAAPS